MKLSPEPGPDPHSTQTGRPDRYRALFDSIDEGFCVIDIVFDAHGGAQDYIFREVNPAFVQQTGLADAVGRRMREMVPEHEQHWFDIYGKVAKTGQSIRFQNEAKGLHRWYNVYAFRFGAPHPQSVAVLFSDITQLKQRERRAAFLVELSHRLASVRDPEEIQRVALTALGTYLAVDRSYFAEHTGDNDRVVIGPDWAERGLGSIAGELERRDFGGPEWWHCVTRGDFAVHDVTTDPLTRDRMSDYAQINVRAYAVQPFRSEGPRTILLVVAQQEPRTWTTEERHVLEDVVARVWPLVELVRSERAALETLEASVADRTARLRETVAELESFSYSISHDLRAPLRAMQTFASILDADFGVHLGPEGREYLKRIVKASDRMDQLIKDVLIYSRLSREEMPLQRVELGTFLADLIESYPQFGPAQLQIDLQSPLLPVCANAAALTQCVSNLLGNAAKFVAPGVAPHVRVWTEARAPDRVRVHFRDNGVGLDPANRERIFDMFYQLEPGRGGGTGIGLAVVRRAVERMGGAVGVESEPGAGSTFWLELDRPTQH
ncbi:MAG: hypothetical protein C0518_12330 [Opitutus sp.]|nr:hypothetical protein [Opitutus sp.]